MLEAYYPREHYNSGFMILKQAEHYLDEEKRMAIAKKFIHGSVKNMLAVLKYYNNREKDLDRQITAISDLAEKIDEMDEINKLMAIEGNIREIYYGSFDIIVDDEYFEFGKRTKQPPKNRMNSLISFGNSILLYDCF